MKVRVLKPWFDPGNWAIGIIVERVYGLPECSNDLKESRFAGYWLQLLFPFINLNIRIEVKDVEKC